MTVNFESLSDVLKNGIRRKIILTLSEKGSISYVDLMDIVGIKNTGRFNYHLKILGDLIQKDESGKYSLSDKGHLAVQFLQKSVGKETEQIPRSMNTSTFVTRAFNLGQGFVWLVFVAPFMGVLFEWYLYFVDPSSAFIGNPTIPLIILTLLVGGGFVLFCMAAFPRIEIDRDSAVVSYAFVRLFFGLEEIGIDSEGHILRLGEGSMTNWFVPFKERECMAFLNRQVGVYRTKPLFLIYLLPLPILGIFFRLGGSLFAMLAPSFWAILWGVVAALSMTFLAYGAPVSMRIGNLRRGASAIVFGFSIGFIIFFLIFFSLQVH